MITVAYGLLLVLGVGLLALTAVRVLVGGLEHRRQDLEEGGSHEAD